MAHPDSASHEEVWLHLPWLANGRLPEAQRERALRHVAGCSACTQELAVQQQLCAALTTPDRISYAAGPSLAKVLRRIDAAPVRQPPSSEARTWSWRQPRLAWAASLLVACALGSGVVYHEMAPDYRVHSDAPAARGEMLHVVFARELTIGQVEQLLQDLHAQVVEGPGDTGIFGLRPAPAGTAGETLPGLAARLRADPRVRWVEPTPGRTDSPDGAAHP